jgi:hypothetical protein
MQDRLDVVADETSVYAPPVADQAVLEIPSLGTSLDDLRGHVERLERIIAELTGADGG